MNYLKIYNSIVEHRKVNIPNGYLEKHHIIPRCLGGSDSLDNIVSLTAREHFICHWLLIKIYKDHVSYHKLVQGLMMMCMCVSNTQQRIISSRFFEKIRIDFSKAMSLAQHGNKNSQFGKVWYHNLDLKQSKRFLYTDEIPEGWIKGRKLKFNTASISKTNKTYKDELTVRYTCMYNDWVNFGYTTMCEIHTYTKSKPNLIRLFKKYVVDYVPYKLMSISKSKQNMPL